MTTMPLPAPAVPMPRSRLDRTQRAQLTLALRGAWPFVPFPAAEPPAPAPVPSEQAPTIADRAQLDLVLELA